MSEYEREARRERLEALRSAGIDPYPARVTPRTSKAPLQHLRDVRAEHADKSAEQLEQEAPPAAVCGRIMAVRSFGKLLFLRLFEDGETLQLSVRQGPGLLTPAETVEFAKQIDVGDFVLAEGLVWRTRAGELTVDCHALQILAKSLRPLPEKWHGLSDVETRLRQRYLDLLTNPEAREVARVRSGVVTTLRVFLNDRGFLEVETPILQPLYGGANARPFTTHHNALSQDLYLRISDELYLKRLVVGGLDRVYEIGHNFRNEGIDRTHNPEFCMLECYQAYADYRDMMDLAEAMVKEVLEQVEHKEEEDSLELKGTTLKLHFRSELIDCSGTWPRLSMREAIERETGIDILAAGDLNALRAAVQRTGLEVEGQPTWAKLVDEIMSECVEPKLRQPTFITDYPVDLSPLAKRSRTDARLCERFELFIAGMEIGNAFSEENDPDEQRQRFEAQKRARAAGDDEAHPLDEDYLRALEHGLPPTGGLGVGVDRLVMLLADAPSVREAVLFPHLRPEQE